MITLQKLSWSNCFSYGPDNEIDLGSTGLTQIIGTNGVGKSSIPLILEEVLFNKNSKGVKKSDIPNRYNNSEEYKINLQFSVDSDQYVVDLSRKKTLKLKVSKNGEDISSHTATNTFKTLEAILGIDAKTFSQLVYQSTTSSLQFLTATDSTRKKFLIDLLSLTHYTDYFEVFKKLSKDFGTQLSNIEAKMETIEKWLSDNKLDGMMVLPTIKIEKTTEEGEKQLGSLMAQIENISSTNKKISSNLNYKQQLEALDMTKVEKCTATELLSDATYRQAVGACKSEIARATQMQAKLSSMKEGGAKCPTCLQSVDIDFINNLLTDCAYDIQSAKTTISEHEQSIEEIRRNNQSFEQKQKIQRSFESLYRAFDPKMPSKYVDINDLTSKAEALSSRINTTRLEIKKAEEENLVRERNNTRIQVIKEQRQGFENQLSELEAHLAKIAEDFEDFEILKKAFSTNGLPAYKIENLVKELEGLVNKYLGELSDGRFTLEFVISNDKLNVVITDNGKDVDISSLSSGELARVNTSTLLAIRNLMNSISRSRINILFLDEVINVLDDAGREKLVDVLIREQDLNIFIVSHQWTHPLLSKLAIIKEDNVSRIDNGR